METYINIKLLDKVVQDNQKELIICKDVRQILCKSAPNHLDVAGQGGEGEADELSGGGGGDGRGPGAQLHRAGGGDH